MTSKLNRFLNLLIFKNVKFSKIMSKCISIKIKTSNKNCFYNSAFYGTLDKSIEFKIITIILVEVT